MNSYGVIHYPFCYRGSFEYDKFVLNYLQYSNMVSFLEDKALQEEAEAAGKLKNRAAQLDAMIEAATGESCVTDQINSMRLLHE